MLSRRTLYRKPDFSNLSPTQLQCELAYTQAPLAGHAGTRWVHKRRQRFGEGEFANPGRGGLLIPAGTLIGLVRNEAVLASFDRGGEDTLRFFEPD